MEIKIFWKHCNYWKHQCSTNSKYTCKNFLLNIWKTFGFKMSLIPYVRVAFDCVKRNCNTFTILFIFAFCGRKRLCNCLPCCWFCSFAFFLIGVLFHHFAQDEFDQDWNYLLKHTKEPLLENCSLRIVFSEKCLFSQEFCLSPRVKSNNVSIGNMFSLYFLLQFHLFQYLHFPIS